MLKKNVKTKYLYIYFLKNYFRYKFLKLISSVPKENVCPDLFSEYLKISYLII